MIKDWNQRLLDDLENGLSKIAVVSGSVIAVGVYDGLRRAKDGEWYVLVRDRRGEIFEVPTRNIDNIKRNRRR